MIVSTRPFSALLAALPFAAPLAAQTPVYTTDGAKDGARYGHAVSGIGDRDGDGFADVLVGEPFDSTFKPGAGAVHVVSGRTGLAVGVVRGDGTSDYLGWSVAAAGDVNADGVPDFIAGAPGACAGGQIGYARVYSGADASPLHTVVGESVFDLFGFAVSGIGDVDLDGFADFAVGAHEFCNGALTPGYVKAYRGDGGAEIWRTPGDDPYDGFGWDLAPLGDYQGDGVPDVLVGAPGNDGAGYDSGRFYVLSGTDGAVLYFETGEAGLHSSGWSVTGLGDADQDGMVDYAIGVPGEQDPAPSPSPPGGDSPHPSEYGKVQIHDGASQSVLYEVYGPQAFDHLGWAVAGLGDVNADGAPEVVAAATRHDVQTTGLSLGPAYLEVVSSADGGVLYHIEGPTNPENFGVDVAATGDVNGDGVPDFVFGSEGLALTPGLARVYSGRNLELSSAIHVASIAAAESQDLMIETGAFKGGVPYQVVGSFAGTTPGFPLLPTSVVLPLNKDVYTNFTFKNPNSAVLQNSKGFLDPTGAAVTTFTPPAAHASFLIGKTVHHAVVLLDPVSGLATFASNAVPLTILP